MVFPSVNKTDDKFVSANSELAVGLKFAINNIGRFRAIEFVPYLPAIDRALNVDNNLTSSDLTPPFSAPARSRKIVKAVGIDGYILLSLDSETSDETAKVVKVNVSGSIYNVQSDDPVLSRSVVGTATGVGAESMSAVEDRAVKDAASQLAILLSPKANDAAMRAALPNTVPKKKTNSGAVVGVMVAVVLLDVFINNVTKGHGGSTSSSSSSSSSGTGGGTVTGPPSPP
jgi:hypothetical protein